MALAVGTRLGPYRILSLLGAGGMGEVYKATDTRLERTVAIKILKGTRTGRFEREARVIASLNHPHICTLHDVGPDYLVMEYIEGTPLRGPLPPEEAIRVALQIADAVGAAHGKGIVHRDLKPGNILMTNAGIKLLDFGLAKLEATAADGETATTQTQSGTILGTAAYMSPEQAQGQAVDARSDIFSFGVVLYELLSGRQAFGRDNRVSTVAAILRDEPLPVGTLAELEGVVLRCLRKSPADRFQTIAEVEAALEQVPLKPGEQQPSIAVLPFANMSGDKENEYFSDGLAEEITNALSQIFGLKVIARTSAFAFKGKQEDVRRIAEALDVAHVLEGSVRRAGTRVRVTAQLIAAADGSNLWSERYDRDMTDIFAIQDDISQALATALKVKLLAPRRRSSNIDAYQHYLRGLYYCRRYTQESLAKGKESFEQALALDPNFAAAYLGLAEYYYLHAGFNLRPAIEVLPLAKLSAEKALALDSTLREAHAVLGEAAAILEYDWKTAEREFQFATAAEPVSPIARYRYALYFLLPQRRFDEAVEQHRRALETDPLSMPVHFGLAYTLYLREDYDGSLEYCARTLEIDQNYWLVQLVKGLAQFAKGLVAEAIDSLEKTLALVPWYSPAIGILAAVYVRAGNLGRGEELIGEAARHRAPIYFPRSWLAGYYAIVGDVDRMFEFLDQALVDRDSLMTRLMLFPWFAPFHSDPRYHALLRRMNLE